MKKILILLAIVAVLLAPCINASVPSKENFDTRILALKEGNTEINFEEVKFKWDNKKVVVYGNAETPERKALLEFATAVLNNEAFEKAQAYKDQHKISVTIPVGCDSCKDLKSKGLYSAIMAFSANPDYEKSLRKELETLKEKPIVIVGKPNAMLAKYSTMDKGLSMEILPGKGQELVISDELDVALATSEEKVVVTSFFDTAILVKRHYFVRDYSENENGFSMAITSDSTIGEDFILFEGFAGQGTVAKLPGNGNLAVIRSLKEGKILFSSVMAEYFSAYGKEDIPAAIAGGEGKSAKGLVANLSNKGAYQEVDYARFVAYYTDKKGRADAVGMNNYTFNYEGQAYNYLNVAHNSNILFDPIHGNFGLETGSLAIKKGGKAVCSLGGGGKFVGLKLAEGGCSQDYILVYQGKTYSYTKDGKSLFSITSSANQPAAFFTSETDYKAYVKKNPNGPAALLTQDKEGVYTVESKGILQYAHLNTEVRTTKETTETTFKLEDSKSYLWVRTGEAYVTKDGASLVINSVQDTDCVVSVKQPKATEATRMVTESLYVGGTVRNSKCLPGNVVEEAYLIGPAGTICVFGNSNSCSLTEDDIYGMSKVVPLGVPLQNKVNSLIYVTDILLKIKLELAKKYGVDVPEAGKPKVWAGLGYTFWTLQDMINLEGLDTRTKFGLYLQDTIWALKSLKGMLERGVEPAEALESYKQMEGSTEIAYELLSLVDSNGKIEPEELFTLAEKFRAEGEKTANWWSFDYLKNDYFAHYYLAMELAMEMWKIKPVELENVRRSINYYDDGSTTLSYLLHTRTLLEKPPSKGMTFHIAWSKNLNDIIKTKEQIESGSGPGLASLSTYDIILKDGSRMEILVGDGPANIKKIEDEYKELLSMEKNEPKIVTYGSSYDKAIGYQKWEGIKDFFAQWVDPFLVTDAAFQLSKWSIKGLRYLPTLKSLNIGSLGFVRPFGLARAMPTEVELLAGKGAKGVVVEKRLADVGEELFGGAELLREKDVDELVELVDRLDENFEAIQKTRPEIPERPIEIILPEKEYYKALGGAYSPGSQYRVLVNSLKSGALNPIKFEGVPYVTRRVGNKDVPVFFLRESEADSISYLFEKTGRDYVGLFSSFDTNIYVVVDDKLIDVVDENYFSLILKELVEEDIKPTVAFAEYKGVAVTDETNDMLSELTEAVWHEGQHAEDFVNGISRLYSKSVGEGRALAAPVVKDPQMIFSIATGAFPSGGVHRAGQIDFLTEFLHKFGKRSPKCELCSRVSKMRRAEVQQFLKDTKEYSGLYNQLREDATHLFTIVGKDETQKFAENFLIYYRSELDVGLHPEDLFKLETGLSSEGLGLGEAALSIKPVGAALAGGSLESKASFFLSNPAVAEVRWQNPASGLSSIMKRERWDYFVSRHISATKVTSAPTQTVLPSGIPREDILKQVIDYSASQKGKLVTVRTDQVYEFTKTGTLRGADGTYRVEWLFRRSPAGEIVEVYPKSIQKIGP